MHKYGHCVQALTSSMLPCQKWQYEYCPKCHNCFLTKIRWDMKRKIIQYDDMRNNWYSSNFNFLITGWELTSNVHACSATKWTLSLSNTWELHKTVQLHWQ
jgi:hypothetical protein